MPMRDEEFWDKPKETRSRAERETEILAMLRSQLRYVYDTLGFYRRHYDEQGFHPDCVASLEDFTRYVPVVTKQMLRAEQAKHGPFGQYLGANLSDIVRVHGSSGTSGKPTLLRFLEDRLGLHCRRYGAGSIHLRRAIRRYRATRDGLQSIHGWLGRTARR